MVNGSIRISRIWELVTKGNGIPKCQSIIVGHCKWIFLKPSTVDRPSKQESEGHTIFSMSLATLYRICLDRIYGFLKEGMWKPCIQNPFSELPTRAADDLMELTESRGGDRPKISDVILLLTSGRLTRLDLCPFDLGAEKELIVRTLQTIGSNYLLNLDSYINKPVIIYLVRKILSWNPHIEELHLDIQPGFDIIRKCQKLRILRFYSSKYVFG
ncbi:hypothetical protein AVEN_117605-1, partial [Araneus ventricosus]